MANFEIAKDWETSERAGAGGMYQIESLTLDDEDVTDSVDQGIHFSGEDSSDIIEYLSKTFDIPKNEIDITDVS